MRYKTSDFDFDLPENLIAKSPAQPRDSAKLLNYSLLSREIIDHSFYQLPDLLDEKVVLIFNDSKVDPVRLNFQLDGVAAEMFFLEKSNDLWKVMVRPGKKFKLGSKIKFADLEAEIVQIDMDGYRLVKLNLNDLELKNFLDKYGKMPVPPYIKGEIYKERDYNTVYANKSGSVAAPTAGLHFTNELIARLISKGIKIEYVTLKVGLGTFLPVKANDIRNHKMHSEEYSIDYLTAKRLNKYVKDGYKIIPVGTTSLRVLESNYSADTGFNAGIFNTNIFIFPGYKWKVVNGLITNFHLPKSTLLMLVASMIGKNDLEKVYKYAIQKAYKFYSFGDGMLIK